MLQEPAIPVLPVRYLTNPPKTSSSNGDGDDATNGDVRRRRLRSWPLLLLHDPPLPLHPPRTAPPSTLKPELKLLPAGRWSLPSLREWPLRPPAARRSAPSEPDQAVTSNPLPRIGLI